MDDFEDRPAVDFSDVFKQSSKLVAWSPDGTLVAAAVGQRLAIRLPDPATRTLQIVHLHMNKETIEHIEWSCDGQYVLCAMYAKGLVQIWSIDDPDWTCRINEGIAGLVSARWSPDGRHILTTSDFSLHLTVWSLLDRSTTYIKNPKPQPGCVAFSNDGEWMAAADRSNCKDYVGIYHLPTREIVRRWEVPTIDLESIAWSPDGKALLVCDSALQYLALMYAMDGTLLGQYSAYDNALGIKSAAWSPTGKLVALGSYDGVVRVLSASSFAPVSTFDHSCSAHWRRSAATASSVASAAPPLQKYREVDASDDRERMAAHAEQIGSGDGDGDALNLEGFMGSLNIGGGSVSGSAASSSAAAAPAKKLGERRLVVDDALQLSSIERTRVDPLLGAGKMDAWSAMGASSSGGGASGAAAGAAALLKIGVGTLAWSVDGRFIASRGRRWRLTLRLVAELRLFDSHPWRRSYGRGARGRDGAEGRGGGEYYLSHGPRARCQEDGADDAPLLSHCVGALVAAR